MRLDRVVYSERIGDEDLCFISTPSFAAESSYSCDHFHGAVFGKASLNVAGKG